MHVWGLNKHETHFYDGKYAKRAITKEDYVPFYKALTING